MRERWGWWTKQECRLKCEFGAGVFVRLDRFEYLLVSLSKTSLDDGGGDGESDGGGGGQQRR
jgi:hypothetical protein